MAKNLDWELVSSEYMFRDDWFTARRDVCRRPDGKIISPYYVLEYPDWATALALTVEGKVLLVRQYRHPIGRSVLEIPGGCVDATDAGPDAAIRRELLEETGYRFDNIEFLGTVSANPSTNSNLMYMYLATGGVKVQDQSLDQNEEIEVYEFTLDELEQLLWENKIIQSMHVSCIMYGLRRLGRL